MANEVEEISANPDNQLCKHCKHEKGEHKKIFSIMSMENKNAECNAKIKYKGTEYRCTCTEFVSGEEKQNA